MNNRPREREYLPAQVQVKMVPIWILLDKLYSKFAKSAHYVTRQKKACVNLFIKGKTQRQHYPNRMSVKTRAVGRRSKPIYRRWYISAYLSESGLD